MESILSAESWASDSTSTAVDALVYQTLGAKSVYHTESEFNNHLLYVEINAFSPLTVVFRK
jgi:hypothetical protein